MESNSVCNHTSDNKSGDRAAGVRFVNHEYDLQTELDDTNSYYQLIIKITISVKRRIAKFFSPHLLPAIRRQKHKSKRVRARNYNFECDWLI